MLYGNQTDHRKEQHSPLIRRLSSGTPTHSSRSALRPCVSGRPPLSVPIDLSEWESRKRTAYNTLLGWESPRALTALESRFRPFRDHMAEVEEIRSNG